MAFIEWNDSLSVGIASVDAQHKKLIALVNELYDAMKVGKGKDVLGRVLDGLLQYTVTHFQTEERYMQTTGYPDFPAHKKEHDELTQQALDLQKKYKEGAVTLSLQTSEFLKGWLTKHIQGTDKKYTAHLTSHGVK